MFRFDVSDDSATEKTKEVPLDGCIEPAAVALPAKEIYATKELWNSVDAQKRKQYALSCGKVLTCVCSADVEHDIRHAVAHSDSAIAQALSAETDLLPHIYEGGLKVWECSLDLTEYLSTQDLKLNGLKVLELGCGTGLPALYAMTEKAATVHFQDYNEEVIRRLTIPNVVLNSDEMRLNDCRFFSGDWESLEKLLFQPTKDNADVRYDMILTSETIYSPASYKKLHNVMASLLRLNGVIYLAAKTCYFGVGGGTREFEEYVRMEGVFDVVVVKELDNDFDSAQSQVATTSMSHMCFVKTESIGGKFQDVEGVVDFDPADVPLLMPEPYHCSIYPEDVMMMRDNEKMKRT